MVAGVNGSAHDPNCSFGFKQIGSGRHLRGATATTIILPMVILGCSLVGRIPLCRAPIAIFPICLRTFEWGVKHFSFLLIETTACMVALARSGLQCRVASQVETNPILPRAWQIGGFPNQSAMDRWSDMARILLQ